MIRATVALISVTILTGCFWNHVPEQRRDAANFILMKLRHQSGSEWNRVGDAFFWKYSFENQDCSLVVERTGAYNDVFTQRIPIDRTSASPDQEASSIRFICDGRDECISTETQSTRTPSDQRQVGTTSVLVMRPTDVPKLVDAFAALHRLCDDAYRPPVAGQPPATPQ